MVEGVIRYTTRREGNQCHSLMLNPTGVALLPKRAAIEARGATQ